jgi:purine nucleoside phosphorylase
MRLALIGGTGAQALLSGRSARTLSLPATRWGAPSATSCQVWEHGRAEVWFLPRHGAAAAIPPHRVNYRANIAALKALAPDAVIGLNAVGGITPAAMPGQLALPQQLIDYTWGRPHTFFDGGDAEPLQHVEFDPPFDESLRDGLLAAGAAAGLRLLTPATYGCTQGPRLETAAEIGRLAADGCDLVGMTAMPEAALAREAGLRYAICAVIVNHAAGRLPPGTSIHGAIARHMAQGMGAARQLLDRYCQSA